jgi:glucosyl-3-phosphoglycerate phosphatase
VSAQRVVLLRHGRTAYNAESRFQGQTDIPLDEVGAGQVKQSAQSLFAQVSDRPVRVVSSDLSRAFSTAEPVAELFGVPVETDPALREIYAGEWQGLLTAQIAAGWPADHAAWVAGDQQVRIGGGESRVDAGRRAAAAVEALDASMDGGTLICVAHGGCLKAALGQLLGLTWPWTALEGLRNAHWAELRHRDAGWRLNRWNVGPG